MVYSSAIYTVYNNVIYNGVLNMIFSMLYSLFQTAGAALAHFLPSYLWPTAAFPLLLLFMLSRIY